MEKLKRIRYYKLSKRIYSAQKEKTEGIGEAMNIIWNESQIKQLGKGKVPKPDLNPWLVFIKYSWLILETKLIRNKKTSFNKL